MIEFLLGAGILANLLKAGDLILREPQRQAFQRYFESLTLWFDYCRPIRWFGMLSRPAIATAWTLFSALFVYGSLFALPFPMNAWMLGGALAFLVDLWIMTGDRLNLSEPAMATALGLALPLSVYVIWRFGGPIVRWLVGSGRLRSYLGRMALFYAGTVAIFLVAFLTAPFAARLPIAIVPAVILWTFLLVAFIPNAAGLLMILLAVIFSVIELVLKIVRAVCWRIVEYSKGAFAAVILVLTIGLGVYEAVRKFQQ